MTTVSEPKINVAILSTRASIAANDARTRVILPISPIVPLWPDPTAWWKLDESSGTTLIDELGNYPLALSGDYTHGSAPMVNDSGKSLTVNNTGVATRADIATPGIGEYAVEFWAALNGTSQCTVFSKQDDITGMRITLNNPSPKAITIQDLDDVDYILTSTAGAVDDQGAMTHYIAQRRITDGVATLEIYLDGVLSGSKVLPTIINIEQPEASLTLFSGAAGRFDDVRYYSGIALTAEEALARYNATTQIKPIPQFLGIDYEDIGYQTDLITNGNNVVMFRTNTGGMSRSLNGGVTFTPIARYCGAIGSNPDIVNQTNTCLRYLNASTWIASFLGGYIARTTNDGDTWTIQRLGTNDLALFRLEVDPLNDVVMAYDSSDLADRESYRSPDGGASYISTTTVPQTFNMGVSLLGTWIRNRTLLDASVIERSTDGGANWTALPAYLNSGASSFAAPTYMNRKTTSTWAVMFTGGKMSTSTDDGVTWIPSVVPTSGPSFGAQNIAPGLGSTWAYVNPVGISTNDAVDFTANLLSGLYVGGNTLESNNGQFVSGFHDHYTASLDNLVTPQWIVFRKYAHTGADTGGPRALSVFTGTHWLFVTGICNGAIWNAPTMV